MSYKNLGGRPLKFKSVDLLEKQIEEYFNKCDKEERPYTASGLALFLDTDRVTLLRWQDEDRYYKEYIRKNWWRYLLRCSRSSKNR